MKEVSHLEPAVVLGMYTWDDQNADQNQREMDVEISRWGDPASKNAQYVIQPYYVPVNAFRFMASAGTLTHSFGWEPGRISFRTTQGSGADARLRSARDSTFAILPKQEQRLNSPSPVGSPSEPEYHDSGIRKPFNLVMRRLPPSLYPASGEVKKLRCDSQDLKIRLGAAFFGEEVF